jgi:hypothetical protein
MINMVLKYLILVAGFHPDKTYKYLDFGQYLLGLSPVTARPDIDACV